AMKRSRSLTLTSLMAAGGVSLTACGDGPPQVETAGPSTDAYAYQTLQECKDRNEVPDDACETADKAALDDQEKAPRYDAQATCEEQYGPGQCVPRSQAGGGSFWGPLVAGFVVGRMMDGGWGGRGLYRDWRDGGFYTGSGGRVATDYSTGRTRIGQGGFDPPEAYRPPAKVQSRASVISRGGFGGNMSNRSYSGGRWGG
ncbi:MAG: DUF1190 domain-containing protein, partial [Phenylobacterium sp.]|nr:DUF1190 domain-containing protein [Phenylobacterium sp.]